MGGGKKRGWSSTFSLTMVMGLRWSAGLQMIRSASLPGWIVPSAETKITQSRAISSASFCIHDTWTSAVRFHRAAYFGGIGRLGMEE